MPTKPFSFFTPGAENSGANNGANNPNDRGARETLLGAGPCSSGRGIVTI